MAISSDLSGIQHRIAGQGRTARTGGIGSIWFRLPLISPGLLKQRLMIPIPRRYESGTVRHNVLRLRTSAMSRPAASELTGPYNGK
jgi:hypothetical protein